LDPYLLPVGTAAAVFPILALVLLVPFSFVAYRSRGRLGWLRSLIFFSFLYFAIAAFFLTLMPLPRDPAAVCRMFPQAATPQLVPGNFLTDFAKEAHGNYTPAALLGNPALYQVGLNAIMLLPLGVFLRYYAGRGLAVTTAAGLGASLLFEVTQGTGIYGLYPCPCRLADVDDLLLNTGGAMFGWLVAGRVMRVLPDLVARDEAARRTPVVVVGRRLWAFVFDAVACVVLTVVNAVVWVHMVGSGESAVMILPAATVTVWYVIIPRINRGATLGKWLMRITLVGRDGTEPGAGDLLLRYLPMLAGAAAVGGLVGVSGDQRLPLMLMVGLVGPAAVISALVVLLRGDRLGPHELLSGVRNTCRRPRHRPTGRRRPMAVPSIDVGLSSPVRRPKTGLDSPTSMRNGSPHATMFVPTSTWTGASAAASGARRSPSRSTPAAAGAAPRASMASSAAPTTGGSVTTVTWASGA
jgi:glycopeptide antibiotics resistance protein